MNRNDFPIIFILLWIVMAVISLVVAGVAIWLGIELVQWIVDGGLATAIHGKS